MSRSRAVAKLTDARRSVAWQYLLSPGPTPVDFACAPRQDVRGLGMNTDVDIYTGMLTRAGVAFVKGHVYIGGRQCIAVRTVATYAVEADFTPDGYFFGVGGWPCAREDFA